MKVVWNIIKKILSIFGLILSPLKRLICRRKRKNSDTILPLVNHYPSVENLSSNGINHQVQEELGSWDTWEDESAKVRSVQQYRQQQLQQQTSQEDEPEMDYFSDMTPKLKKQKKVFIKKKDDSVNTQSISSKLAPMDIPMSLQTGSELGSWDDDGNAWEAEEEDDLSWEADNVIREKRRQERQQRHLDQQRKKQERDLKHKHSQHGHLNAVKLS